MADSDFQNWLLREFMAFPTPPHLKSVDYPTGMAET